VGVDAVHDLGADVVVTAMGDEGVLEPGVAPQVTEPGDLVADDVDDIDPAGVVGHRSGEHPDTDEQSVGVDQSERFASGDLLAAVIAPGLTGDGGGATHGAGVDHPRRRVRVTTIAFSHQAAEPVSDAFPGAVA